MASLMEELMDVLDGEEQQYRTLIQIGGEKRDAVVNADIAALEKVTAKEQDAADTLLQLGNRRTRIMRDMANVMGKDSANLTIKKMAEYLDNRPEEQERLLEQRERLLEAGTQMQAVNKQNEELLRQALEMVEFDMTLLNSMRQAPETANYDKNAVNTGDRLASSGFDAKQ